MTKFKRKNKNKNKDEDKKEIFERVLCRNCGHPTCLSSGVHGITKQISGGYERWCPNCDAVDDQRPSVQPGDLKDLQGTGLNPLHKENPPPEPEEKILTKKSMIYVEKRKGDSCRITDYNKQRLCEAPEWDSVRAPFERIYGCEILPKKEVDRLILNKVNLEYIIFTDEQYAKIVTDTEKANEFYRKTGKKEIELIAQKIPNTSTDYRHCKRCRINMIVNKAMPLPTLNEVLNPNSDVNDDPDYVEWDETFRDNTGHLVTHRFKAEKVWKKTAWSGDEFELVTEIDLITKEEQYEGEMKKETEEKLENKRKAENVMFGDKNRSPVYHVFREPTKADWKLVHKMIEPISDSDPINKDDPINDLKERYENGKIAWHQKGNQNRWYYRCLCCNNDTSHGIISFEETKSELETKLPNKLNTIEPSKQKSRSNKLGGKIKEDYVEIDTSYDEITGETRYGDDNDMINK